MNKLSVIGSLCLLQDKHCNSLEGNLWQEVVSTSKETILDRDSPLFTAVLSEMDLSYVDTREVQVFVSTILKYVVKSI